MNESCNVHINEHRALASHYHRCAIPVGADDNNEEAEAQALVIAVDK